MIKSIKPSYILLVIFVGLLIIFRNYVFGPWLYIFTDIGNDTITSFYPNMLGEAKYWKTEGMPLWSFGHGIGQTIYSSNFLNPLNIPKLFLSESGIAYSIIYMQLAKIMVIAFLFYKYLSLFKLKTQTIWIASILFIFNGFLLVSSSWYGHTTFYLRFILTIYAIELILKKQMWWPLGIALFYSFGTSLYFIFEFSLIYVIIRLVEINDFSAKYLKDFVYNGMKGIGLGILLSAPFIGSLINMLSNSPRIGGEVSYANELSNTPMFEMSKPLEVWTVILRFFSPDILGSGDNYQGFYNYFEGPNLYIGILCLLILPQVFLNISKKQKITYAVVLFLWVLILAFPYFRYAFYRFAGNYYKSGVAVFLPFTFLYFAIKGLNQFFTSGKINLKLLWGTGIFLAILLLFLYPAQLKNIVNSEIQYIALGLIIAYTAFFTLSKKKYNSPWLFGSLIFFVFGESMYMGNNVLEDRVAVSKASIHQRVGHNDYTKEAITHIKSTNEPFYRIEKTYGAVKTGYNDAQAQGYFSSKSYNSFNHKNYIEFLRNMEILQGPEEVYTRWVVGLVSAYYIHGLFSIKYVLSTPNTDEYVWKTSYTDKGVMNGIRIYENKNYIPLGIPFEQYLSRSDFNTLRGKDTKHMSIYKSVIIEDNDVASINGLEKITPRDIPSLGMIAPTAARLRDKAMTMKTFSQNKIVGNISIDQKSMVFFSIPYDVGWSAKVNGVKQTMYKINLGMTGLLLEPGTHDIILSYLPPYFRIGWILFAVGILVLTFLVYQKYKKKS